MASFIEEFSVSDNDEFAGPLGDARESSEKFADSYLQHHILKEVVQAIKALGLLKSSEYSDIDAAAMKQLEMLWTSMADELKEKGIDA